MKKFIGIFLTVLFSFPVYGETTRLECVVSGDIQSSFMGKLDKKSSREIGNELINVEVSQNKKSMFIEIQGRKELELITSTNKTKSTVQVIDGSTSNSYHIRHISKDNQGEIPTTISQDVKIDRVSGQIYVEEIIDGSGLSVSKTKYFGKCQSLGDKNKF